MNDLGLRMAWSALQTTLFALAASALYALAARRRPASGAAVAAAGLGGVVVVTVFALWPPPAWWDWRPSSASLVQRAAPGLADPPVADAPTASPPIAEGPAWPIHWVHGAWEGLDRATAPFAGRPGNGWGVAAVILLCGIGFCLIRLALGLLGVGGLRRRSRPIEDPDLRALMNELRRRMGCRRGVDLRESPGVVSPAVVGWLRPVVLLPADWRGWGEPERRAVLAHELAHVLRFDYPLGLLVRLGVALHFYHPLVHWLADRLRLQQELAADALAAPLVGGREPYLLALARLALRQDDRRWTSWPANSLFSRGTLMRRIQLLRTKDGYSEAPASRWGRALIAALLAAAVVGVTALHCPAQKVEKPAPAGADRAAEPTAEAEPFDLSYIPSDAMGVFAFRPSSVFGRPGLKMQAAAADKQIADLCKFFGLPRAIGLSVGQIAQVYAPFRITTDKTRKEGQSDTRFGMPLVIRSVKDFDWAKELKGLVPGVTEARSGSRLLYKLPGEWPLDPGPGKGSFGYFIPDGRTVVFDTEAGLRRLMEGKPGGAAPPWAEEFQRVGRGMAVVVLDNRDGAWTRELAARDKPEPHIAPFLEHTSWVTAGVGADEDFTCDASARFDGDETAEKALKTIRGGLDAARAVLTTEETFLDAVAAPPDEPDELKAVRRKVYPLLKALVHEPDLKRDGASLRLRCRAKCDVIQVISAILEGQFGL